MELCGSRFSGAICDASTLHSEAYMLLKPSLKNIPPKPKKGGNRKYPQGLPSTYTQLLNAPSAPARLVQGCQEDNGFRGCAADSAMLEHLLVDTFGGFRLQVLGFQGLGLAS